MYKTSERLPKHRSVPLLFSRRLFKRCVHFCYIFTSSSAIIQTIRGIPPIPASSRGHVKWIGNKLRNDDSQIFSLSNSGKFQYFSMTSSLMQKYPSYPGCSRITLPRHSYPRKPFMISTIRMPGPVVL